MKYTLIRTDRRTLSMKLTPDGDLVMRVPKNCTTRQIERFVNSHMDWLEKHREILLSRKAARENVRLRDGQELLVCGVPFLIRVDPTVRHGTYGDRLVIPNEYVFWLREYLVSMILENGRDPLRRRLDYWAERMGLTYRSLKISRARSRWGSCSRDGVIRISVFLLLAPMDLIDYVLVHELSHRKYLDHSAAFWAVVETTIPDWKERRARLREYQFEPLTQCLAVKEG